MRLVSLVPSTTQTLSQLGYEPNIVGCTKFCVDPPHLHRKARLVGGTKDPDLEAIKALNPTHIFVNSEENKPEHILACQAIAPSHVSLPKSPRDVPEMLRSMGRFLDSSGAFEKLAAEIEKLLNSVPKGASNRRFLYFIWRQPWMVAGRDTYISRLLEMMGWENACVKEDRYPQVQLHEVRDWNADVLFFSSEPFPFRKRDVGFLREEWSDAPQPMWIDGKLMSWHGALTKDALEELLAEREGRPQKIMRPLA